MKKIFFLITTLTTALTGHTQTFRLEAIPSVTIPVTESKMTNLVFPEAIQTGVKVSTEIMAQKVHGVDNVIEIKALRRHFTTTNLTIYGKDGQLYSFVLKYIDDTSVLSFRVLPASTAPIQLSDLPTNTPTLRDDARQLEAQRQKLHLSTRTGHLSLRLTGVYSKDNLEWLTFKMTNRSALDFHPGNIRFYLQDKKKVRRRAIQELDIRPIFQDNPENITSKRRIAFAAAFNPFHIGKGKRLICEIRAKDGRILIVKLSPHRSNPHLAT